MWRIRRHDRNQVSFEQLDSVRFAQHAGLDHSVKLGDGQPVESGPACVSRRLGNGTNGHLKILLVARRCTTDRRATTTSAKPRAAQTPHPLRYSFLRNPSASGTPFAFNIFASHSSGLPVRYETTPSSTASVSAPE